MVVNLGTEKLEEEHSCGFPEFSQWLPYIWDKMLQKPPAKNCSQVQQGKKASIKAFPTSQRTVEKVA